MCPPVTCVIFADDYVAFRRFNKYSQICARAVRHSLKEGERVKAEKRGLTALRYQHWANGQGGEHVRPSICDTQSFALRRSQIYLTPPEDVTKSAAV